MAKIGEVSAITLQGSGGNISGQLSTISDGITELLLESDQHTTKLDTLQADVTVIKTNTTPA